jgi:hypothetical protein
MQLAPRGYRLNIGTFGDWVDDDFATEMGPTYRFGTNHFWNGPKKSSEWKSLLDLALVFMIMPLMEVDDECMFSLKDGIIGSHAARASTELLHTRARIKARGDAKWRNSVNQEQISFITIAFMLMRRPISKERQ